MEPGLGVRVGSDSCSLGGQRTGVWVSPRVRTSNQRSPGGVMLCLETARLKQTEHCYIHSREPECRGSLPRMLHLQCADENVFPSVSCGLHLFMFLPCSAPLPSHLSNGSKPACESYGTLHV